MRIVDVIKKKRDGEVLTTEEIKFFAKGCIDGTIKDYQISAFLMAVYFSGLNSRETADLTFEITNSGEVADFSSIKGFRADKHSTGGVGDKTSLVVAPIVASLGVKVAKMSGRGLGHTGGTVDKLEAIKGFNVNLSHDEFIKQVNDIGISIIGQTLKTAPLDKKLYALRDVTATVDNISLIVASIMGKKLCVDDDGIVLDVKTGSGAFCKTYSESKALATQMVDIGKRANKKIVALITDMDKPLGNKVGNLLEVYEAVDTLNGKGPKDFTKLCIILSAYILYLANKGTLKECENLAKNALKDKSALNKFNEFISRQGGDLRVISERKLAKYSYKILASESGYIYKMDTEKVGLSSLNLKAGRNTLDDKLDYYAGIDILKKTGDFINKGETIAILYANDDTLLKKASEIYLSAITLTNEKPKKSKLVKGVII